MAQVPGILRCHLLQFRGLVTSLHEILQHPVTLTRYSRPSSREHVQESPSNSFWSARRVFPFVPDATSTLAPPGCRGLTRRHSHRPRLSILMVQSCHSEIIGALAGDLEAYLRF
jgi:hypothetical protein